MSIPSSADCQFKPCTSMGKLGSLYELEERDLMMYGQMTAGSWIYIGAQGILQGTYLSFVEAGKRYLALLIYVVNSSLQVVWAE